jgi:hypothetical protein
MKKRTPRMQGLRKKTSDEKEAPLKRKGLRKKTSDEKSGTPKT